MEPEPAENKRPKSLWEYIRAGYQRLHEQRTISFYLVFAVFTVFVLSLQVLRYRDDPFRFAFLLSLLFIFFFIVVFRAIIDLVEILRRNLSEKRDVYRTTLGDEAFARELGRRVREKRQEES